MTRFQLEQLAARGYGSVQRQLESGSDERVALVAGVAATASVVSAVTAAASPGHVYGWTAGITSLGLAVAATIGARELAYRQQCRRR